MAIGGIGIDRSYIENIATEKEIPLDSIVVKMSHEEAIMPMKTEILNSMYKVMKIVEDTQGKSGWGEAYRRILKMDPSLEAEILSLRSHSGACYALGHCEKYLKLLQEYRKTH